MNVPKFWEIEEKEMIRRKTKITAEFKGGVVRLVCKQKQGSYEIFIEDGDGKETLFNRDVALKDAKLLMSNIMMDITTREMLSNYHETVKDKTDL